MHVAELASVTFIKDQNYMFISDLMLWVLLNKYIQFLNGCYNNSGFIIFQLFFKDRCTFIAVGCPFFESVIFFDRLIIQILTVNNKQHFINV